jgi:hypothetical protein
VVAKQLCRGLDSTDAARGLQPVLLVNDSNGDLVRSPGIEGVEFCNPDRPDALRAGYPKTSPAIVESGVGIVIG